MKWRVVGWATYDDRLEEGEASWAASNAIVDEVNSRGYLFSGWSHQEGYNCAPVLNDGKIRRFSQRGWGTVMAEAHGYTGTMDYAKFAFFMERDKEIRPEIPFDRNFVAETDLSECFTLEVSNSVLADANNGVIRIADADELRYLDRGDTLVLRVGEVATEFVVTDVNREKDLSEDELLDLEVEMHYGDSKSRKQAQEKYAAIPLVIIANLKSVEK